MKKILKDNKKEIILYTFLFLVMFIKHIFAKQELVMMHGF